MNNYLFLERENLKKIFFDGFIEVKANNNTGIYNKLTDSYEKCEPYFIMRPKLEEYLNDNSTDIYYTDWYYVISKNFKGVKKHRIYLHLDGKYIAYVAKRFIEKCKKRNVQFWFKFQLAYWRADSMVFYPTDEQFPIFNEIMEENEIIKHSLLTPPISTIIYNGKFGYGKEVENDKSWSDKIANLLLYSSNHVLYKYASLMDYSKYSIDELSEKFSNAFFIDYEKYLKDNNRIKDYIFYSSDAKKEFKRRIKSLIPKVIKLVKNYDKLSKYINSNETVGTFSIGEYKYILRISTLIIFMKYFIDDIVNKFGEDRIISTLKSFVELNIDSNVKIYDIDKTLLKEK